MASISTQPGGRRTIQFVAPDRSRKTIRLGTTSKRNAEAVKARVEELLSCRKTNQPLAPELSVWLTEIGPELGNRLAAAGLIEHRAPVRIGDFITKYIVERRDTKASTVLEWKRARNHLIAYFGENRCLRDITPHDADCFRLALSERGLAEATARRTIGIAKQFFRAAERARLIDENPFADLVAAVPANKDRAYFVTLEEANAILNACPDHEWRLLIALARYGGLRIPSEPLAMRLSDIDFENRRIPSPKTAHHPGGQHRFIPLSPELESFLVEASEQIQRDPADAFLITRSRSSNVNLRTRLLKIMERAGVTPWPKLWQNMRSSRETELVESFPAHVVAAWIGHSVAVAEKNYLQVTEEHFARALQNPVQSLHAPGGAGSEKPRLGCKKGRWHAPKCTRMGVGGLEPPTSPLSGVRSNQLSYTPGGSRV